MARISNKPAVINGTIAAGSSLSGAIDCGTGILRQLFVTSASMTAASVSFKISHDGISFYGFYRASATEVLAAASAQKAVALLPDDWQGVRYLKVQSGLNGTVVDQASGLSFSLIVS